MDAWNAQKRGLGVGLLGILHATGVQLAAVQEVEHWADDQVLEEGWDIRRSIDRKAAVVVRRGFMKCFRVAHATEKAVAIQLGSMVVASAYPANSGLTPEEYLEDIDDLERLVRKAATPAGQGQLPVCWASTLRWKWPRPWDYSRATAAGVGDARTTPMRTFAGIGSPASPRPLSLSLPTPSGAVRSREYRRTRRARWRRLQADSRSSTTA